MKAILHQHIILKARFSSIFVFMRTWIHFLRQNHFIRLILFLLFFIFLITDLQAQVTNTGLVDTTGGVKINKLAIGGYLDAFYGVCTEKNGSQTVPYFVNMNRNNELNINLAYLDIRYTDSNFRVRFVPGFGTYMNANYISEPGTLKNIVEGSVGFRLNKKRGIWLDAGVLGSPYTNESAVSKDHLKYTRSIAPEYVPYYLSGVKLSMPFSKKVTGYLYVLNGWQQILDLNSSKSIGTQIEFRPTDKLLLNWNTFIGDERSVLNPNYRLRIFTDLYAIYNPSEKWNFTSCVYFGNQEVKSITKSINQHWWQANIIGKYNFNSKHSLSGRMEYWKDPSQTMIVNPTITGGFSLGSASICYNLKANDHALIRFEARQFLSDKNAFLDLEKNPTNQMSWLVGGLTVWF
jgi:hypothetical protein